MAQQGPFSFEDGTRRRTVEENTIPFVDSQPQTLRLRPVGYLSGIRAQVALTLQTNGPLAFTGDALIQLGRAALARVVVSTNMQANLVNCSAHGLNLLSYISAPYGYSSDALDDEVVSAPAGAGQHTLFFEVMIPIALNDGVNYTMGLLNLQNDDVSVDLRFEWANMRSLFADPTNLVAVNGFAAVELTYYDVPDLASYLQPTLDTLIQITETVDSITIGTGEHVYPIPKGNVQAQVIHQITEGATAVTFASPANAAGKITTYELKMQGSTTDSKGQAYLLAHESRKRYGRKLPAGVIVNDALWDTNKPGQFDLGYQLLDTAQFTKLDSIIAVQGLNSGNSKLRTIRREIVRLYE